MFSTIRPIEEKGNFESNVDQSQKDVHVELASKEIGENEHESSTRHSNEEELRHGCISSLQNIAMVSALMSGWIISVYVGTVQISKCGGDMFIYITLYSAWITLGFFFVAILTSLAILVDIDGVPSQLILDYMTSKVAARIMILPYLSFCCAILSMVISFIFDFGSRTNCFGFYFACAAGSGFIGCVVAIFIILRKNRLIVLGSHLSQVTEWHTTSIFSTWIDRIKYDAIAHHLSQRKRRKLQVTGRKKAWA
jgi:hypothetical protein